MGARSNSSVGQEHNRILDEIFDHLKQVNGLNRENAHEHVYDFFDKRFDRDLASLAKEYYDKYRDPKYDIYEDVSPPILTEIRKLDDVLDNSDFANMQEFKKAVLEYVPTSAFTSEQEVMWNNYTDVLVHSTEYWGANLDSWNNLLGSNTSYDDDDKCPGGWWKRLWCNVKKFAVADANAALKLAPLATLVSPQFIAGAAAAAVL